MKVSKISSIITPKTTGYASAAGLCLTVLSGMSKKRLIYRAHKPLAFLTAGITALHIGLIEYYHHKYSKHKQL